MIKRNALSIVIVMVPFIRPRRCGREPTPCGRRYSSDMHLDPPSKAPGVAPIPADTLIKDYILSNGLRPGDPLPTESEMCAQLGCSRNRYREGLQRLQATDAVEVRHGVGAFVGHLSLRYLAQNLVFQTRIQSRMNRSFVMQLFDARLAIDRGMAPEICRSLDSIIAEQLVKLHTEMVNRANASEPIADLDREYHLVLMNTIHNDLATELVSAFWYVMDWLEDELPPLTDKERWLGIHSHKLLLTAAREHDLDGYYSALGDHYKPLRRQVESWIEGAGQHEESA